MKIPNEAVDAAYIVAKRVYEGSVTRATAIKGLVKQFSLNPSSAADMIDNVLHMIKGERYERKINTYATKLFLERIYEDFGLDTLGNAVSAVVKHVTYYEALANGSKQPSIEAIVEKYRAILKDADLTVVSELSPEQRSSFTQQRLHLEHANAFDPTDQKDARERTIAAIVRRQGQSAFRSCLLELYQERCAISGCDVSCVLEAAHIVPYKGAHTNHPTNGLLLRADLHTLFDLGLLAVVAASMTIVVAHQLQGTYCQEFAGKLLTLPADKAGRPSPLALDQHRKMSKHSKWIG